MDRAGDRLKHTLISLDPLRDASLHAVIDAHLATLRQDPANRDRPFDQLKVEAVMIAVNAGQPTHRIPDVVVHVDHESLCHGRHDDTVCETIDGRPMPVSTVQRLCCEAVLQAVIVQPDGTVDSILFRAAHGQPGPTTATRFDVCHLRPPVLRGRVLPVPDAPHRVVLAGRHDGSVQSHTLSIRPTAHSSSGGQGAAEG